MPSSSRTTRSSSPSSRPSTIRQRSSPSGTSQDTLLPTGPYDNLEPEAPVAPRQRELGSLGPPPAEERRDVAWGALVGPPGLGRLWPCLECRLGEVERKSLRLCTRARVEEYGRAGPLRPVDAEPGEEAGHRPAVPDEDPLTAAVELEPEPPAQRPGRLVGHRPYPRHLVQGLAGEHAVAPRREEVGPAREIVDRGPEPPHRRGRPLGGKVVLDRDPVAERIDEVPGRARPGRIEAGAPKPEGVEHTAAQGVLVAGLAPPRDDLAEQAEGEVGVVPRLARPQHALGVLQPADQLLAGGRPQRLPDLAGGSRCKPLRCANPSATVGPAGASGRCVRRGSPRSSTIASRSWRMQTAVNVFVIEPMR